MEKLQARLVSRGAILVAVMIAGLSLSAVAYQQPRAAMPDIEKVAENLYLMAASYPGDRPNWTGGNTAAFVTDGGVVLVDTKLPGYGQDIIDQVRTVTEKPITMIINTHTHFDHAGSNTEFPETVVFVAHEGTRANMARTTCEPVTHCEAFNGENEKYLPSRTYTDRMTLFSGMDQIDLYHFGPGHTSGDSFVVFRAARTMHTGDMFQWMNVPFIDVDNSGGNATAFAETLTKARASISDVDHVIAGHSNTVLSWDDFSRYTDFHREFRTAALEGMRTGRSVDDVANEFVARSHEGFEVNPDQVKTNMQAIYDGR